MFSLSRGFAEYADISTTRDTLAWGDCFPARGMISRFGSHSNISELSFKINTEEAADEGTHPVLMSSGPVHAPAERTAMELRLRLAHTGRQEFEHVGPGDGLEGLVASQTTRERAEKSLELKPSDHFNELLLGLPGPDCVRTRKLRMCDERPVSAQEHPPPGDRIPDEIVTLCVVSICRVKS